MKLVMPMPVKVVCAAGLLLAGAAGCSLMQPAVVKQKFLLPAMPPAPPVAVVAPVVPELVRVNLVGVAVPFSSTNLVYRRDDLRYETDFYNEYFVAPRDLLTERVRAWVGTAGVFRGLALGGSPLSATYELNGFVAEFYGDLRPGRAPEAVLTAEFVLSDVSVSPARLVWHQAYSRRVPLAGNSPAQVAQGLDTALTGILGDLCTGLRTALTAPPKP